MKTRTNWLGKCSLFLVTVIFITIFLLLVLSSGCIQQKGEEKIEEREKGNKEVIKEKMDIINEFKLKSPAFENNEKIPRKYTCQGDDINPPLKIEGTPPEGAKSLVLIVDDPDAPMGTWDHWLVWNIPPIVSSIEENSVPEGAVQGKNSWGNNKYGGPCPPSGTHRYFFKLYALDTTLDISENSQKKDLEEAMEDHILAQTKLVGLYAKE
jgi:hypothetical protein